jgi:hypothetical protein
MMSEQIVLFLDDSEASLRLRDAVENLGIQSKVIFSSGFSRAMPAIRTQYGVVAGSDAIEKYFRLAVAGC